MVHKKSKDMCGKVVQHLNRDSITWNMLSKEAKSESLSDKRLIKKIMRSK